MEYVRSPSGPVSASVAATVAMAVPIALSSTYCKHTLVSLFRLHATTK